MTRHKYLDIYIQILKTLRCTKTIKELGELVDSKSTTLYHTVYYLQEKGLVQENGTILIQSEKNLTQAKRARTYITTEKGRNLLFVLED